MKTNTILTVLLSMLSLCADAQGFVAEDKVWNFDYVWALGDRVTGHMAYFIDGDTVVGGKEAKKLYIDEMDRLKVVVYDGALREEGRKVWFAPGGAEEWQMVYDFDLEEGDEGQVAVLWYPDIRFRVWVEKTAMADIKGVRRKAMLVRALYCDGSDFAGDWHDVPWSFIWIEGIGSSDGIMINCDWPATGMTSHRFTSCIEGGQTIYDRSDAEALERLLGMRDDDFTVDAFHNNTTAVTHATETYDLQGRKATAGQRGVVIERRGGTVRKVVNW